jgi:NADP-dependent 3-hydroxy acid dehydrogenase YdfG
MTIRTVFLTGASSGIGRTTAERLYKEGWRLGLAGQHLEDLRTMTASWEPERVYCYLADVSNSEQLKTAIDDFASHSGNKLDLLINNAGTLTISCFEELDINEHQRTINVNVMGVINGCHAAFPYLKASARGQVINLSSASSVYGIPEFASYSASKFAVKGLTEALDLEWQTHGIRVCDVIPPFVATNMLATQEQSPRIMNILGVDLTADDVTDAIFKQIDAPKTHRPVSAKFSALYYGSTVTPPSLLRQFIRFCSR